MLKLAGKQTILNFSLESTSILYRIIGILVTLKTAVENNIQYRVFKSNALLHILQIKEYHSI